MGTIFEHVFSSDTDAAVRTTIPLEQFYTDIKMINNAKAPMAGFPCQPFSQAGRQEGFTDSKGRGDIFFHIVDYLEQQHPRIFILENIKGLVTLENGKYHNTILACLKSIGATPSDAAGAYNVSWRIMSTADPTLSQSMVFCR